MRAVWCCTTAVCTFTTETRMSDQQRDDLAPLAASPLPRSDSALVPRNSIAGRALIAIVAIMTFLASLTTGAVILVSHTASEWQSDVAREVTIQIIPAAGRDAEADVARAASIASHFPGIEAVQAYTR